MEFEINFLEEDGPADAEIALSGVPTPGTFAELNERLSHDPRFRSGLRMLVDLAALDTSELADDGVGGLAETVVERDWYHLPSAVAIVAPAERTYNAALLYRAHLGGSKSNRQVFRDKAEAVAWLATQA